MELYHHLIDTDSLSARIFSLADRHIPPGISEEERETRHEAVDEAVEHLLKNDLHEVMERVEAKVKETARTNPPT